MEGHLEDELSLNTTPMLSKKKVNFTPNEKITHLSVNNDYVVLAMINNILLRIDLKKDSIEGNVSNIHFYKLGYYFITGRQIYVDKS